MSEFRTSAWLEKNGFEWNAIADVWVRQADRLVLRFSDGRWTASVVGQGATARGDTPEAALAAWGAS